MAAFQKPVCIHLVGSTKDDYYTAISIYYARQMVNSEWCRSAKYEFQYAVVNPDLSWQFPETLDREVIESSRKYSVVEAINHIAETLKPEIMIPHMYCPEGMTSYRSLFESLLNIPVIGCDPTHMALTTDKDFTRAIVAAHGVSVPAGVVISAKDDESLKTLSLPLIIKPANEDNSIGLSLANTEEELVKGIDEALEVDNKVIVEQFIPPGKEIRVGLIENLDGTLQTLPMYEYFVSDSDPIRTMAHKYTDLDKNGEIFLATGQRQCPADLTDEVVAELNRQAILAHKALKCRDFSLFDFRVDPEGKVFFLEACSYCSFSPRCVLMSQSDLSSLKCPVFFDNMIELARKRKWSPPSC